MTDFDKLRVERELQPNVTVRQWDLATYRKQYDDLMERAKRSEEATTRRIAILEAKAAVEIQAHKTVADRVASALRRLCSALEDDNADLPYESALMQECFEALGEHVLMNP